MHSTPDAIDNADEKSHSHLGIDEEFLNLLDEESLMAVSEVPFHTSASTVNPPQNQKAKSKASVSNLVRNLVRWSKCKLASEIHTPEASPPPSKKVKSNVQKSTSNSKTPQTRTKKQQNVLPGKSSDIIFLTSTAKSFMNLIEEKHIISQRNIDVDDFTLKTNLMPLLKARKLLKSGFVKVAADKEEPPEPLLQIDYKHFEGNHFNDMESTQSSSQQGVSAVIQYLDAKLQANREEMRVTLAKQSALEEEHKHLTWLREVVFDSAATEGVRGRGLSGRKRMMKCQHKWFFSL
ncbi:unnamed protein product [Cuscuta campestris]|uniref:Uncharacterized protein n=1 Tax=Cuscuta campestris TaxID=132261 RepID=A0A484M439_9ASTE|nr:unnamed protein product [Cuscuta campestris]